MDCWICGKANATITRPVLVGSSFISPEPSKHHRCYCEKCFEKERRKEAEERKLYIKLKKREMKKQPLIFAVISARKNTGLIG